jgi:hypothetical protein
LTLHLYNTVQQRDRKKKKVTREAGKKRKDRTVFIPHFVFVFDFDFHDGSVIGLGRSTLCVQGRQTDKQLDRENAPTRLEAQSRKPTRTTTSTVSFKFDRQAGRDADIGKDKAGADRPRHDRTVIHRDRPDQYRPRAKAGPIQTIRCEETPQIVNLLFPLNGTII